MIRHLALLLLGTLLLGCSEGASEETAGAATDAAAEGPQAAVDGVTIGGEVATPYTLTAEILAGMPLIEVQAVDHGGDTVQFRGARMSDVLARAGVQLGEALRGPRMVSYLLVDAADGYRAVFALAEVDPGFGHGEVYLVTEADGTPLDADAGPFRVVAPGDSRPARWVRQVIGLSIRTASGDDVAP